MASTINEHTQYVDSSGAPIVSGILYIGTVDLDPKANPIAIFSDRELTVAATNPQTLDSLGRTTEKLWIGTKYSLRVSTSADVQVYQELDNGTDPSTVDIFKLVSVAGSNTITASTGTSIGSYTANQQFTFETVLVNTGAVTLNVDSVGAKAVVKNKDQPLVAGELEANQTVLVVYNATNDNFELVNPNTKIVHFTEGSSVVSAATIDFWDQGGNTVHITGTTGITAFAAAPVVGDKRELIFDGVVTVTNSANLQLPGGNNFTTAVNDKFIVYADALTTFRVDIFKKNGEAVVSSGTIGLGSVAGTNTITATASPTITAYENNRLYAFTMPGSPNTGAVTLNIDSIGAKAIVKNKDQAILNAEFEANQSIFVMFNSTGDNFEWVNQNNKRLDEYIASSVASTATTEVFRTDGNTVHITGTTTITSLGTAPNAGAFQHVVFDGILLLTHGANLNLPGDTNYTTAPGDEIYVRAETATQHHVQIFPADGKPIIGETILNLSSVAGTNTITATASPTITAYVDKQLYIFTPGTTNTGNVTLNIDSVGAKAITKNNSQQITNGEFVVNRNVIVMYLSALDQFTAVSWDNRVIDQYAVSNITSTATTDIWSTSGNLVGITGSTTITSFDTAPNNGAFRWVRFASAITLTHGANLKLPNNADYTTSTADLLFVIAQTTTQHEVKILRFEGTPVITATAAETVDTSGPSSTKPLTPAGFGGTNTLAADGFYTFPDGYTIQWGDTTIAAASGAVVFPVAFTTLFNVTSSVSREVGHWTTGQSTTGMTVNQGDTTSTTHDWKAFGRITS